MKSINRTAYVLLFTFLLLFSGGCTDTVEADHSSSSSAPPLASSGDTGEGSLNILASFQREDGSPLTEQSIRLSAGDKSAEYPLDEWGELRVSGLPRKMTLEVTVLDKESGPLGTITISFSEGTVIDASTDQEGAGMWWSKRTRKRLICSLSSVTMAPSNVIWTWAGDIA